MASCVTVPSPRPSPQSRLEEPSHPKEDLQTVDPRIWHSEYPRQGLEGLLKTGRNSDLSFLVEGKVLRAHRIIVASQCDYFDSLLYGHMRESECNEIKLEDTPWQAFQILLEYMYTGQVDKLDFQTSLDLLSLADRYNFTKLHSALEGCLCEEVSISNVLQLMFYADTYNAHRLHRHCSSLIDSDAEAVLSSKSMRDLPKEYMKLLLSRDTFVVSEVKIVEAVKNWKDCNGLTLEEITDVLDSIRLSEISYSDMKAVVCPSGLYPETVLEAVNWKKEGYPGVKPRGNIVSNLFDAWCNVEVSNFVVTGSLGDYPPSCLGFRLASDASAKTSSAIVVKFDSIYLINHFKFDGVPDALSKPTSGRELQNPFLYVVDVSSDNDHWETVIDHSICKCYATQDLYFPCVGARTVRLVITKSRVNLQISVSVCGLEEDADDRFRFFEGGSTAPVQELSPRCMMHWVSENLGKRCILTFHQPYHISKIRFRVKGMEKDPDCSAQVIVNVSLYNKSRYSDKVDEFHASLSEDMVVKFEDRLVSLVTIAIPCYFNEKTGEDLRELLDSADLKIVKFLVMCE